jgi:hypothetical protein
MDTDRANRILYDAVIPAKAGIHVDLRRTEKWMTGYAVEGASRFSGNDVIGDVSMTFALGRNESTRMETDQAICSIRIFRC